MIADYRQLIPIRSLPAYFSGAAYVFSRGGSSLSSLWTQLQQLGPGPEHSEFGSAVALDQDGDTIIVGAPSYGAGACRSAHLSLYSIFEYQDISFNYTPRFYIRHSRTHITYTHTHSHFLDKQIFEAGP